MLQYRDYYCCNSLCNISPVVIFWGRAEVFIEASRILSVFIQRGKEKLRGHHALRMHQASHHMELLFVTSKLLTLTKLSPVVETGANEGIELELCCFSRVALAHAATTDGDLPRAVIALAHHLILLNCMDVVCFSARIFSCDAVVLQAVVGPFYTARVWYGAVHFWSYEKACRSECAAGCAAYP